MTFTPVDPADHTSGMFTRVDDRTFSHVESRETRRGAQKVWEKVCTKS